MNRKGSYTQYDIQYHLVWTTKYRYKVLNGKVAERLRKLIRQGCESKGITIIQGSIGKEHVHILISCTPSISVSEITRYLKYRSSRLLQEEFKSLKQRYWGQHLWAPGYFCRTVGTVTEEMIKEYIKNQKTSIEEIFKIEQICRP